MKTNIKKGVRQWLFIEEVIREINEEGKSRLKIQRSIVKIT